VRGGWFRKTHRKLLAFSSSPQKNEQLLQPPHSNDRHPSSCSLHVLWAALPPEPFALPRKQLASQSGVLYVAWLPETSSARGVCLKHRCAHPKGRGRQRMAVTLRCRCFAAFAARKRVCGWQNARRPTPALTPSPTTTQHGRVRLEEAALSSGGMRDCTAGCGSVCGAVCRTVYMHAQHRLSHFYALSTPAPHPATVPCAAREGHGARRLWAVQQVRVKQRCGGRLGFGAV